MVYIPHTERPTANNKYYITKASGGYSSAIKGKCKSTGQPDRICDTLANCVGYSSYPGSYMICQFATYVPV